MHWRYGYEMEAQMVSSRTTLLTAPIQIAISIEIALDCLHGYLDCELGSLEDLLDLTGHEDAIDDICTLSSINLDRYGEPLDTRQKLELARPCLMRLNERVRHTSREDPFATTSSTVLDNWLNHAEVLLQEIIDIIYHSLAS
ncbi:hypothetical protein Q4577_20735 [Marinovum sp. 2_MG-2023]|nr:hypothetical protein [Marinovum sp. 2_MG-2023]MDO6732460.1 hypothetical protein [Marinovum sp. 2_MG-2023]MDO6781777.1 hypothetical protein [Marinovum sp. 1_MG-2023]